jgi:hypothetical protein
MKECVLSLLWLFFIPSNPQHLFCTDFFFTYFKTVQIIKFIEQGPSWETNGPCGSTEDTCSLWFLRPHYCVNKCIYFVSWHKQTQSNPPNYIFKIHLHKCLPSGLILSSFLSKSLYEFQMLTLVLHDLHISLSLNWSPSYIIYILLKYDEPCKLPRWIMKTNTSLA